MRCVLQLATLLAFASADTAHARHAGDAPVRALDGVGRPVAWWAVLKLPAHVESSGMADAKSSVEPTPCDCPPPDCSGFPTADWSALDVRATGLCYLYADARQPTFRHFRELGYDCLGQGGNDPLSHTLCQQHETSETSNATYWALFNDQLNGIAATFKPGSGDSESDSRRDVCGGGDAFSAHAKGAVGFKSDGSGGFFLQTSTPNYPDPTRGNNNNGKDVFVPLGCQADNNVQFAQHLLALSLGDTALRDLGSALQLARLCSGNFFHDSELHDRLASAKFYADGPKAAENTSVAAFYHALLDSTLPEQQKGDPMKTKLRLKLETSGMEYYGVGNDPDNTHLVSEPTAHKWTVFEPLETSESLETQSHRADAVLPDAITSLGKQENAAEEVEVLVKSPRAAVPPWALVAEALDSDMSVASWWDGSYGIPSICAGDAYTSTPQHFCLDDPPTGVRLNPDGSAPYNIENLLRATWRMSDSSRNLTWQLVGGRTPDGNHAKWGLTTPRSGVVDASKAYVTFGDLNMEGFPCSKACNGSQAGRGGSFFSFLRPNLHQSLAQSLISDACRCSPPPTPTERSVTVSEMLIGAPTMATFEELRMCHRGCVKKLEKYWEASELPVLSVNASSFWGH